MEIRVLKVARSEPEKMEIHCHEMTEEVKEADIWLFCKVKRKL